jgi:hypothetical protein
MSNIEYLTKVSFEFAPPQLPPGGTARAFGFDALLLSHRHLCLAKCRSHLHRVTKTLLRIDLNRIPEHFDDFGSYTRLQLLLPV